MSSPPHFSIENCIEDALHVVLGVLRPEVIPAAHATGVLRGSPVLLAVSPLLERDSTFIANAPKINMI